MGPVQDKGASGRRSVQGEALPSWASVLAEVFSEGPSSFEISSSNPRYLKEEHPFAFEELNVPFVEYARSRVLDCVGAADDVLATQAMARLERSLLDRLTSLSWRTLEFEFSMHRLRRRRRTNAILAAPTQRKAVYEEFIATNMHAGLRNDFLTYPVLPRWLATATENWVETTAELIRRLRRDRPQLDAIMGDKLGIGTDVDPFLSDPHNRGRTVSIITFSSGRQLVYKPRHVGLEATFSRLLEWANRQGVRPDLLVPIVVDRCDYGWMTYHGQQPCECVEDVENYYRRAGAILCLVYAVNGTDFHCENLIAHGSHPVLVDLETLLQPAGRLDPSVQVRGGGAEALAFDRLEGSVLRTMLLPEWVVDLAPEPRDLSGLGTQSDGAPSRAAVWRDINQDAMELDVEERSNVFDTNQVFLKDKAVLPHEFTSEIVEGFERVYRLLQKHKRDIFGANGISTPSEKAETRLIFRGTQVYGDLLRRGTRPQLMKSGVDQSIELDFLARPLTTLEGKPLLWSMLRSEINSIWLLDIPRFSLAISSVSIHFPDEANGIDWFPQTGVATFLKSLEKLNDSDLEFQLTLLKAAMCARFGDTPSVASSREDAEDEEGAEVVGIDQAMLIDRAVAIGDQLSREAIRTQSGLATWITVFQDVMASHASLGIADHSLYSGVIGIALFFAALHRASGIARFGELAGEAANTAHRSLLSAASAIDAFQYGLGGASGLGSLVFGLVQTGCFLNKASLIDSASEAAKLITPDLIEADRDFDVTIGGAGAILGLLCLHAVTKDATALSRAETIAEHLLRSSTSLGGDVRGWPNRSGKLMTGFSHGAAGIAYALLRLSLETSRTDLQEACLTAAAEAVAFERFAFVPEKLNWLEQVQLGSKRQEDGSIAWCYGAPGIVLARIGGLPALSSQMIQEDIRAGLERTLAAGSSPVDHLCCGSFGLIETLFTAGLHLRRDDLCAAAFKRTVRLLEKADYNQGFAIYPYVSGDNCSPSFFKGKSGIGYQLLRLAAPSIFPSVLLWEPPIERFDVK